LRFGRGGFLGTVERESESHLVNDESMEILADRVDRIACGKCGKVIDVSELASFSDVNCPHCGTQQKVPAVLGSFLLAEQMGAGGMGAVYRAVDQALGRFVAIKVMKQQLGADTELVESFLREARAAAALNHPNIVQIYSCGQEKGQPYIVMELVGGGRMDQLMEDGKKVDEVRLLQVALDVAEGLKAANGANLVHGDIKPANILFDQNGTAKVVDFGLAQFVNRQQEQGGIWGTPYYISPERARGGKADHRSDIYSLGATLYHALTGLPPFDGKTATDVVVARLKAPPVKILDLAPTLQPQTAAVIERMMAADPVLRYPTSASLLADLRAALQAAKTARSASGRAKKHHKREWGHWIVGGIALLVMLGFIIYIIHWFRNAKATAPAADVPAATNAVAGAEPKADPVEPPKGPETFFRDTQEVAFVQALVGVTNQPPVASIAALDVFAAGLPPNSARQAWARVLQAVPCWLAGEDEKADQGLRAVAAQPLQQKRGHVVYMPQVLALYLIGDLNFSRLEKERAEWPAWYGDLASGLMGFRAMKKGDLDRAAKSFDAYLNSEGREPAWVYTLRPAARIWREQLTAWDKERQRLLDVVAAGDLGVAREALAKTKASSPPMAQSAWKAVQDQIDQVEKRLADSMKAEEEAKRQVLVQQEKDRVTEFLGTNTHFTGMAKEYRKAVPLLLKLQDELQQPEGREHVNVVREHMDRMENLKGLLIKEMGANPYRGTGQDAGWEAVGANVLGIRVTQAGRVTQLRTWAQINPRFMTRLVKHYIEQGSRSAAEKADLYLSLAIFCQYNEAMPDETAATYLRLALDADRGSAAKARRLLPDVTPAEPAG
jgi:hypothetical protein